MHYLILTNIYARLFKQTPMTAYRAQKEHDEGISRQNFTCRFPDSDCDVAVTSPSGSRSHQTSLREALVIRITDFKGCVLLPLLRLLFEKPTTFCRCLQGPKNSIVNFFRGPLKKCTNRRPFKSAKVKTFSIFHAVDQ